MNDKEKLEVAIAALKKIAENDPGPAHYIAKSALEEINERDISLPVKQT